MPILEWPAAASGTPSLVRGPRARATLTLLLQQVEVLSFFCCCCSFFEIKILSLFSFFTSLFF